MVARIFIVAVAAEFAVMAGARTVFGSLFTGGGLWTTTAGFVLVGAVLCGALAPALPCGEIVYFAHAWEVIGSIVGWMGAGGLYGLAAGFIAWSVLRLCGYGSSS